MIELLPFIMFLAVCLCLLAGYPVALTLAGVSFLFALLGALFGLFDMAYLAAFPNRLFWNYGKHHLGSSPTIYFYGCHAREIKALRGFII